MRRSVREVVRMINYEMHEKVRKLIERQMGGVLELLEPLEMVG